MREHQREKVRETLLNGISENKLIQIDAAHSDIEWVEYNREFTLNGMLFDVVKQVAVNGKLVLFCFCDDVEKDIAKKQESNITGSNHTKNKDHKKSHNKSPFSDYTATFINTRHQQFSCISNYLSGRYTQQLLSVYKSVPAPPPKVFPA